MTGQIEELLSLTIQHGKTPLAIQIAKTATVLDLKTKIKELTDIDSQFQKLLFKGTLKDENTLENIKDNAKIILMASSIQSIMNINIKPTDIQTATASLATEGPASWCSLTEHKKIIAKGKPENVEQGLKGHKFGIPERGVQNLWNHTGVKTRLTFKSTDSQIWIGTAERTQKLNYNQIHAVKNQPIDGQEEYHIVALQLGPTEKSNYYLYYVPCQFVEAIKDEILGKWM